MHTFETIKENLAKRSELNNLRNEAIRTSSLLLDKIKQYPRDMIEEGIESEIPNTNWKLHLDDNGLGIVNEDDDAFPFASIIETASIPQVTAITTYVTNLLNQL